MTREEIVQILELHGKWVRHEPGGTRAYLAGVDLSGAKFSGTNLSNADLFGARLSHANLSHANLSHANLYHANLSRADLSHANLSRADLSGANLPHADLFGARLSHANLLDANLYGADLSHANLLDANLYGADLALTTVVDADFTGTCLDPNNPIPPIKDADLVAAGLEIGGDRVYGWRTKKSWHIGNRTYKVGGRYVAPVFSTSDTECHPGIYIAGIEFLHDSYSGVELVRCWTYRKNLHKAGSKFRTRELFVVKDQ